MIISKKYAKKLIREDRARYDGNMIDDGIEYAIITRFDTQNVGHVRLGANNNDPIMMGRDAFVCSF